jgi:hypothetical protein
MAKKGVGRKRQRIENAAISTSESARGEGKGTMSTQPHEESAEVVAALAACKAAVGNKNKLGIRFRVSAIQPHLPLVVIHCIYVG